MNLKHTRVQHEGAGHWVVDFVGDDGEAVSVKVADHELSEKDRIVEHAKRVMIELTGFGTRGGKQTLNRYDALSKGHLEDDNVQLKTTH